MNSTNTTTRAVAFGFAAIVTLAILFGVDSLAQVQHADAGMAAAAAHSVLA